MKSTTNQDSGKKLSKLRLVLMRGLYLLTFIGLAFQAWEYLLFPDEPLDYITGVAFSFWASYATLMGIGVRYPLKMLPLLFLQLAYKATWALGIYLPMKEASLVTPEAESFLWICVVAVILDIVVIPWKYVLNNHLTPFFKLKSASV
ncbi:hypothetical protein [Flagellimonas sp. CMM7]|uniref:hypothetical protein n=1 Tax=Flagellimonas sp. CMM7 TaxID=2654676 RepID=UPI0013D8D50D|nr:hypothetical protein [Flagellimonas sp. CMM7]UII79155.1 hypothetical protein LV704_16025 [Flagellimonas sp. CMM7]